MKMEKERNELLKVSSPPHWEQSCSQSVLRAASKKPCHLGREAPWYLRGGRGVRAGQWVPPTPPAAFRAQIQAPIRGWLLGIWKHLAGQPVGSPSPSPHCLP